MPTISNSSTRKSTAESACTPPKRIDTSCASRTGTHTSSGRSAGLLRLSEALEAEPRQQPMLLLGDAAREEDEGEEKQQRLDGRLQRDLDGAEREEVQVGVGPLDEGRKDGEQNASLHD